MPRPKGYKLSEEAKQRIGDASRRKWEQKRSQNIETFDPNDVRYTEQVTPKKKWYEIWK